MRRLNILLVSLGILTTTTCLLGLWSFHRVSYDLDVDYASDAREDYLVEYEDDYDTQAGEDQRQGERKSRWTKVLGGTEGFYVFENVWIRDRIVCESSISLPVPSYGFLLVLFPRMWVVCDRAFSLMFRCVAPVCPTRTIDMVPNPTSPTPLPRLDYTITSRNPDLRDHTTIAETVYRALHAKLDGHTYPEFPDVPRLVVLLREEAEEMGVPGFKIKVGHESNSAVEGVGDEDEAGSEDRVEIEAENAAEIEIGKELAILQVEEEDDVTRSRSRDAKFKLRSEEWQVKTRRRRWWWDSTWVDGWTGKSTVSSSGGGSDSAGGGPESVRETVGGGMQWEEEGVTVLPGTTVRITTTALRILVPGPQRRRNGLKEAS
jgi:hypothetical protein